MRRAVNASVIEMKIFGKALHLLGAEARLTLAAAGAIVALPVSFNSPYILRADDPGSRVSADFNADRTSDLAIGR